MNHPITTSITKIELGNYYESVIYLAPMGNIWIKKNSKPRVSPVSYTSTVTKIKKNVFNVIVADTSFLGINEFCIFTDGVGSYRALITNIKSSTELIVNCSDIDLSTLTSLNLTALADSYLIAGMIEPLKIDRKADYYVVGSEATNLVIYTKKKSKNQISTSSGGSGGGDTYTNANPTPADLGGISAGSTFLSQTMQQMWDALLYPYQAPAFTSFYINTQQSTLEVGDTSLANPDFRWSTSNSGNVQANSITLRNTTAGSDLATGLANDGNETITLAGITNNAPTTQTFTIRGTNTNSGSFSRNYSINWRWRLYYGESATTPLVEADVEGLRANLLTNTFARTYSMQAGSTYKYIAYPESFGTATSFTDAGTGFAVAMESPYLVSITNAFGQTINYRVHRTTNILNSAIDIIVS